MSRHVNCMMCPNCGAKSITRTRKCESPLMVLGYLDCTNPECGYRWVAAFEFKKTISPSAKPNPEVKELIKQLGRGWRAS